MNRDWVLVHLREAQDELTRTINAIAASPEYNYGEFFPAMQHVYHHLNTAWNSRDASESGLANQTNVTYKRWCSMPADFVTFK
jgi:hypothetical protein